MLAPASAPAEDRSDEELLHAYKDGDEEAFVMFVEWYERMLFLYLRKICGDHGLTEEALQETFIRIIRHINVYDGRKAQPWILTIARNAAISVLRREKRHTTALSIDAERSAPGINGETALRDILFDSSPTEPSDILDIEERRNLIRVAISQLPETQREAIDAVWIQELLYREAAEQLHAPVGTIKTRVHMGRAKLYDLLVEEPLIQELMVA